MTKIEFKQKPRKEGAGLFTLDGNDIVVGRDWALHNEIQEAKEKTQARSCFRGYRSCGACANSRRDATYPKSFDHASGCNIDCRGCEPFRFHDCNNGFMRDARGDAEEFTEAAKQLMKRSGGKPLI